MSGSYKYVNKTVLINYNIQYMNNNNNNKNSEDKHVSFNFNIPSPKSTSTTTATNETMANRNKKKFDILLMDKNFDQNFEEILYLIHETDSNTLKNYTFVYHR